jgi:5-methylcytosine-specific restriction endonuclease McrA
VTLLFLEIAQGVDNEYQTYEWTDLWAKDLPEDKKEHFHFIRSVVRPVPVPKVILLKDFDKRPPQTVKFSRAQVFLRDRHTCQYCYKTLPKQRLNLDHVIPRAQGGKTTWENVVASCLHCNWKKGGRTPAQAGMRLLTAPRRPKFSPSLQVLTANHPTWNQFLFSEQP